MSKIQEIADKLEKCWYEIETVLFKCSSEFFFKIGVVYHL